MLFGDHCVSYGELVDRVLRTATVLRALGCKRGDCVVLLLPDTPSFVSVFFAALHLGAVAVPINPAATCEEVAQIVDRVRAAVVVVDAGCAAKSHEIHHALPGERNMKYELLTKVALRADLPPHKLRSGDVATIVEHHAGRPGQEPGYTLEVFNAIGETIAVVPVRESQIEPLWNNEVLHVRHPEEAVA